MVTKTESNLIRLLKSFGLDKETTVAVSILCKTDETQLKTFIPFLISSRQREFMDKKES